MIKFFLLFFSLILSNVYAFDVIVVENQYFKVNDVKSFIDETMSILPASFHNYIKKNIKLTFSPLDSSRQLNLKKLCYGNHIEHTLGHLNKRTNTITIHSGFIKAILDYKQNGKTTSISCKHKNTYDLAKGTLIHEIAHLVDYSYIAAENSKEILIESTHSKLKRKKRKYSLFHKNKFSSMPSYLYLSGWGFSSKTQRQAQRKVKAVKYSVDFYEFQNEKEHFAVNTQFFLLDKEYKCRRPTLYSYFKEKLHHDPYLGHKCSNLLVYPILDFGQVSLHKLNIEHVREVHYLLAGKSEAMMSRWGHSMLRIVLCPPNERVLKCRLNSANNLILNFAAFIPELSIDSIKGVTGGYNSTLSFSRFRDTVISYTNLENRAVYSYPLKISTKEMKKLTRLAIERVWNYMGEYNFLSNNCSDELLDFFKAATAVNKLESQFVSTPMELRDLLIKVGYIDEIQSLTKFKKKHLYFSPKKESLLKSFDLIKSLLPKEVVTMDNYVSLPAGDRLQIVNENLSQINIESISSLILIEKWIYLNKHIGLQNEKIKFLQELLNKNNISRKNIENFRDQIITDLHRDIERAPFSYGIPMSVEEVLLPPERTESQILEELGSIVGNELENKEKELESELKLLKFLGEILYTTK